MRTSLIALVLAALLALGAAGAQSVGGPGLYAGLSTGFDTIYGVVGVPLVAHLGVRNVGLDNLDLRGDLGFYVTGTGLLLGADALYNYPVASYVDVYGGIGPRLLVDTAGGGATFGLALLGGSEFLLTSRLGVTGEANVTPYFSAAGVAVIVGLRAGVRVHFF